MKVKNNMYARFFLTFFGLILFFNLALLLVSIIPSEALEENVKSSSNILTEEGPFYNLSATFDVYNNTYTDSVIINECYSIDNKTPYESYMKVRKNYKSNQTLAELEEYTGEGVTANYYEDVQLEDVSSSHYDSIGELSSFLDGKITYSLNYGRYWHGYLVLFRPLLLFTDIAGIRMINRVLFLVLLCALAYLLNKRFGKGITFIYVLSILLNGYFSASYSLESAPIFIVTMISTIVLLLNLDKIKNYTWFIFIVGCVVSFVDYLTVPLISLGLPLSIILLYTYKNKNFKENFKNLVLLSFTWAIGYACSWIFKWIQYDLTIEGSSMLGIGFTQSFYRMTRANQTASDTSIYSVVRYCINNPAIYTILIALIIPFISKIKSTNKLDTIRSARVFIFIALMPIVWFFILANHTILHSYFTYRQMLLFTLGLSLSYFTSFFEK